MLEGPAKDALGYVGGGLLAICLIPQIIKLLVTRSARDISLSWTLLYLAGTSLSMVYLMLEGAMAAWIPLVIETAACLVTLALKLLFDHTSLGRPPPTFLQGWDLDASIHSCPGISHAAVVPPGAVQTIVADWSKHSRVSKLSESGLGSRSPSLTWQPQPQPPQQQQEQQQQQQQQASYHQSQLPQESLYQGCLAEHGGSPHYVLPLDVEAGSAATAAEAAEAQRPAA